MVNCVRGENSQLCYGKGWSIMLGVRTVSCVRERGGQLC